MGQIHDGDELVAQVRKAANAVIAETATTREAACNGPVEETHIELSHLTPRDREILSRSYNLSQTDLQVSRDMGIPLDAVIEAKKSARLRFFRKKKA